MSKEVKAWTEKWKGKKEKEKVRKRSGTRTFRSGSQEVVLVGLKDGDGFRMSTATARVGS